MSRKHRNGASHAPASVASGLLPSPSRQDTQERKQCVNSTHAFLTNEKHSILYFPKEEGVHHVYQFPSDVRKEDVAQDLTLR